MQDTKEAFFSFLPYLYPYKSFLSALNAMKRFITTIPPWAFVLVAVVTFVQTANMFYLAKFPISGEREQLYGDHYIIDYIKANGPVDKAGIKLGDTIVSCNGYKLEDWYSADHGQEAGDTLIFGILRNNVVVGYPVKITSPLTMYPGIYWPAYLLFVLLSIAGLYIIFKKPDDIAVKLYFIYIQQYALITIGQYYLYKNAVSLFIALSFLFCTAMLPATLVHFHLVFPQPVRFFSRYKRLPLFIYGAGITIFLFQASCQIYQIYFGSIYEQFPVDFIYIGLWWGTIASFMAIALAIFQLITIKDTLARNQLRIIVIGTVFGTLYGIFFAFFYNYINGLWVIYPNLSAFSMRACGLVLILCLLIAIFRYRIWEIEIIIKRILLYLVATSIIILSYLFLLYLVDLFTIGETKTTRFIVLAVSVIIFLVSRDWLQRLIERIFHRETYDSATVVSEFEEKLAGAYRIEDLGSRILNGLNDIFHFNSLELSMKAEKLVYIPAFSLNTDNQGIKGTFNVSREFENRLQRAKVFSPGELRVKPDVLEVMKAELIVPLVKDNRPYGFFACGHKKSEKVYSMQDIRVLTLIAKRVIALFNTAELYQKDLDRQLMLERERARISQDMHDDIGAGLTKIAMISEAGAGEPETANRELGTGNWERMQKVATTARDMINRLNVIVWALNPRYDNLESLVSYARRYFGEYLENFGIGFRMEVRDEIPDIQVTPDFRRNAFYAWQEAVHNAVKHGKCSEIVINIRIDDNKLFVSIIDNGKGFDHTKPGSGGNGLLNMQKRAEEIGGRFEIESKPGVGTKVSFEF